ncbi:MAG TPA: oligopeptide transporter, OPT family [Planctomycetes bacterium]|nr:oligopeptide transporter, OPT family [Planctomycetota bacterium]HIL35886.1 oligopeptide transporter, OPT family [Planctomycetota bacterium]
MSSQPSPASVQRELTPLSIFLGILLSLVMGAANVYVGLKAGMTVSASIPAAVMAMLVLRVFLKRGSILEANQVQTCASAGESLAAGIIFTVPALVLAGYWTEFDYWTTTGIALSGGLLGVLFMIPMRKVFVVDNPDLPYPEGIACAAVLQAGEETEDGEGTRSDSARALVFGGLLGAVIKFGGGFVGLFAGHLEIARAFGSRIFYYGADISPMLVAVGLIVRLNVALLIFIGGVLSWVIALPMLDATSVLLEQGAVEGAWELWSTKIRYVGVGAMVLGGVVSILQVRSGLIEAIRILRARMSGTHDDTSEDRDLPTGLMLLVGTVSVAIIAVLYWNFTGSGPITALTLVLMLVLSFFMTAVASYIVGLVGNSNSPVSGMTITAVLATGALLTVMGYNEGPKAMAAILGVAAVVCCVACTSGDVCNDLKTGSLVGATPRKQQIMQLIGVTVAAFVLAPVLTLLHKGTEGGIGGKNLPAPQAQLFESIASSFTGGAQLPWDMVALGVGLGIVILILDAILGARESRFRLHLMPLAVGMYLPFGLATPILLGGIIAHFATKGAPDRAAEERRMQGGVLFASGVIAGESLMAVGLAFLAVYGIKGPEDCKTAMTLLAALVALVAFWRMTMKVARSE